MQLKKYIAPTLKNAAEQMKMELGDEAIIIGTRVIQTNNYPAKKMFELTAGVEEKIHDWKSVKYPEPVKETIHGSFEEELNRISNKIFQSTTELEEQLGVRKKDEFPSEITESTISVKKIIDATVDKLKAKEIDESIIRKIIFQLKKYDKFLKPDDLDNYIITGISTMIATKSFNVEKGNKPKIVSLVGPTGVGKTTCIAKLAIISKIIHKLDVGLISIDTFRIGALDQLKVFSEVSGIDMLVAYEPKDLQEIINQFKKKDVVFIDTTGRSQNNSDFLVQANEFLNKINIDETYLVLSSTSNTKTLLDIADKFKIFNYNSLIFTKIDEGVVFGNILNVITKIDVPAVFLTNGQVIPDDIISADADFIAKLIYKEKYLNDRTA